MLINALSAFGVMEGKGIYNRHAKHRAGGAALALSYWEKAALSVPLAQANRPFVVANYGSSQAKNFFPPPHIAVRALRSRLGPDRPIFIYHIDLPATDLNAFFGALESDPDRYAVDEPNVFSCAVGRSFSGNVLPAGHVDLGWSSYSAMLVGHTAASIPGHLHMPRSTGVARAEFEHQSARDWKTFLELRSAELRPGGRLVVVVPADNEDGCSGIETIMDHADEVLAAMVQDHAITAAERERMVLGVWPRSKQDLHAPFGSDGRFHGLIVEHCETTDLQDTAWANYQRNGNRQVLARRHAAYFRSIFAPSLSHALAAAHDPETVRAFNERLEQGLRLRLSGRPAPLNSRVSTIVLEKQMHGRLVSRWTVE
jgi:hypothetical protein